MLISRGIAEGEVITLKLITSEEVIGRLSEETPTHWVINNTRMIGMGQNGPGFMPYLFTIDPEKDIRIAKESVIIAAATDESLAKQFIESTSGIKLA